MKKLQLAVTEFALPSPRTGSIEPYSGYGPLPQVGPEVHSQVQSARLAQWPNYQAEKWITHTFTFDEYRVTVSGRMDGFVPGLPPLIEEIKTAYNPDELLHALQKQDDHPYLMQVRTYGYIHHLHTGQEPELSLHLVSSRTRKGVDLPVDLDLKTFTAWLQRRGQELVQQARQFEALAERRRKLSKKFTFPFAEPRRGQLELMRTVEENLNGKAALLLQAPTGLGKTAGVLFPMLKDALARGQKVLYVTPKNSQHSVAEEAVMKLQKDSKLNLRSATIQAKAKICFKDQVHCDPTYCEYAKDHYSKMARDQVVEKLRRKKNLTARVVQKVALQYEVCPFDLQLEAVPNVDVVICDYNYVFSPRNSLGRLSANGYGDPSLPNLVIDEAHNLPSRAAEYFSATLDARDLRDLARGFEHLPEALLAEGRGLIEQTIDLIHVIGRRSENQAAQAELDFKVFQDLAALVAEYVARYLASPIALQKGDRVLQLGNLWSTFMGALQNMGENFFAAFIPSAQGGTLKIVCCDASPWLHEAYSRFSNLAAFSATLKPFAYYIELLGLAQRPHLTAEFQSPFPREHRKLLIVPQVSTKWRDRNQSAPKIQMAIERIVAVKPGNYFVFFPSFDFLGQVAQNLALPGFEIFKQSREMNRTQVEDVLTALKRPTQPTLVLAVQGGVFAEGVDYPGEMLIGAIVVGPALPTFDFERELLREHYAKRHGAEHAFDYAYTYPAMAKVVQSAGRVIRSGQDRGLIVLMDRRFLHANYIKSMPVDWLNGNPQDHVSQSLLQDIQNFWEQPHELE